VALAIHPGMTRTERTTDPAAETRLSASVSIGRVVDATAPRRGCTPTAARARFLRERSALLIVDFQSRLMPAIHDGPAATANGEGARRMLA